MGCVVLVFFNWLVVLVIDRVLVFVFVVLLILMSKFFLLFFCLEVLID